MLCINVYSDVLDLVLNSFIVEQNLFAELHTSSKTPDPYFVLSREELYDT